MTIDGSAFEKWDADKGELTLFRSGTPERPARIDIEVFVTFGDDTAFAGEHVVSTLLATGRKADEALALIEAETERLKGRETPRPIANLEV